MDNVKNFNSNINMTFSQTWRSYIITDIQHVALCYILVKLMQLNINIYSGISAVYFDYMTATLKYNTNLYTYTKLLHR
jgi:hypothetical protein